MSPRSCSSGSYPGVKRSGFPDCSTRHHVRRFARGAGDAMHLYEGSGWGHRVAGIRGRFLPTLDIPGAQGVKGRCAGARVLHILSDQFRHGDGGVTAWAATADADRLHPPVAVVTSLRAQGAFAAGSAFIDRDGAPAAFGRQWRLGRYSRVTPAPGCDPAGTAAPSLPAGGRERGAAVPAGRYGVVTRRDVGGRSGTHAASVAVVVERCPQAMFSS